MQAVLLRARVWLAANLARTIVVAGLIGIVGGLALGLVAGTRRTESAPARYTAAEGGDPDVAILQQHGDPIEAEVAEIPGVVATTSQVFVPSFLLSPVDGSPFYDPNSFAGDDDLIGTRLVEGRFVDPANPDEFTVNRTMAALMEERFGTDVGDQFEVVSFSRQQVAEHFDQSDSPAVPTFTATLVGVTQSPADFDDPYPALVFPSSFLAAHPDVGVVQTLITARLDERTSPNAVLGIVRGLPNGDDAYAIPNQVVSDSARRAVRFQVTALWIVSAIAVAAAIVLIAQVAYRTLRVGREERQSLQSLGWRRREIVFERGVEGAVLGAMSIPIAAAIAAAATAWFPLGVLRGVEPDPGVRVDWALMALGALGVLIVVIAAASVAGGREEPNATSRVDHVGGLAGVVSARGARMPLTVAARFATTGVGGGRASLASLAVGAIGVAGVIGATTLGWTLNHIQDEPDRWGTNYDQLYGNPYADVDHDIVGPIAGDSRVDAVTGANIGSATINGVETATIGFATAKGKLTPTVIAGHGPLSPTEIGLGAEVARRLDVGIGDTVEVAGATGKPFEMVVVGFVVIPGSAGNGAAIQFDAYRAMNPTATENVALVDFADGAPDTVAAELAAANYTPPGSLRTPPSVRALSRVTAAPLLLVIVLAVVLVTAAGYLLAASVRGRRRDLAILRALGSNGSQLRTIVHLQSSIVATATLAIGVPVGILLGRAIIGVLTDAIGIVPGSNVPTLLISGIVAAAIAVANVLAVLPGRRAARAGIAYLPADA